MKRLLTIGHSYVVAQNRRLAHEMARHGKGDWDVTVAAPERLRGDLRDIELEPISGEACTVVPITMRFGGYPHLRIYGHALRALLRQPWDVVHCWEEPYVVAAAQVARYALPNSCFIPATFQNISKQYPAPVQMIERRVMERANAWIAFGRTVYATQRARAGYSAKPAAVITPGVDIESFCPDTESRARVRHRLGWSSDDVVVGFTGRFVEEKGIGTLLDAFCRRGTSWKLLLVGGGALEPQIEAVRQREPSRVAVVSNVGHDQVADYLNAMDLLCAPSRTTNAWREQFGRMLIEAMACGVAILASASGEMPHVVGDAGVLAPEGDTAAWAAEIERLVTNAPARAALAANGLRRARACFSWPAIAKAHLQFFDTVLAR